MEGWPAQSQDTREVADARVLAGLLAGLREDGQTEASTAQLAELGLGAVDADHLAVRLVQLGYFREDSLTSEPGSDTLLVTPAGRAAAGRAARQKVAVSRAARSAPLRWLYGADGYHQSAEILSEPDSWFYGAQHSDGLPCSRPRRRAQVRGRVLHQTDAGLKGER